MLIHVVQVRLGRCHQHGLGPGEGKMGAAREVVTFEDLPTSEFALDESGNWVDVREPIREEPSGVRRRESTPHGESYEVSVEAFEVPSTEAHHSHIASVRKANRLPAVITMITLAVVIATAASWLALSALPGEQLELRDDEAEPLVAAELSSELSMPVYESAPPPRFEQPPNQVVLEPIIIRASATAVPATSTVDLDRAHP